MMEPVTGFNVRLGSFVGIFINNNINHRPVMCESEIILQGVNEAPSQVKMK